MSRQQRKKISMDGRTREESLIRNFTTLTKPKLIVTATRQSTNTRLLKKEMNTSILGSRWN